MKVFYCEEINVDDVESFSPSASKPSLVVNEWLSKRHPIEIIPPNPISLADAASAHDKEFVDNVDSCKVENGFGTKDPRVSRSILFTCGSMLDAAVCALDESIACAPVSGFHHAEYRKAKWYCTYNGLMIAACKLNQMHDFRVGILDLDQHVGDGTRDIISELGVDFVSHYSQGFLPCNVGMSEGFLAELEKLIIDKFGDCGILLYQAGADPHVNDPLGGWLTTSQLVRRDRIVFETCRKLNLPIAYCHAGGYQEPIDKVLSIHTNTLLTAIEVNNDMTAGALSGFDEVVNPSVRHATIQFRDCCFKTIEQMKKTIGHDQAIRLGFQSKVLKRCFAARRVVNEEIAIDISDYRDLARLKSLVKNDQNTDLLGCFQSEIMRHKNQGDSFTAEFWQNMLRTFA